MFTPPELKLIALSLMAATALTCLMPAQGDDSQSALLLSGAPRVAGAAPAAAAPAPAKVDPDDALREIMLLSAGAGWLSWPANQVMQRVLQGRETPEGKGAA